MVLYSRIRRRLVAASVLLALVAAASGCARGGAAGRATPAPASGVQVAVFSSLARLTPTVDVIDTPTSIELQVARGEHESAQVVVWPTAGESRVVVETGALQGPRGEQLPASAVHAYLEQPMLVEHGSPGGRAGTYVDPLLPASGRTARLTPNARLFVWVDVSVPLGTLEGAYDGAVLVRRADKHGTPLGGSSGILATIPVQVHVRSATLPAVPTLGSHIGVDASQIERFEQVGSGATKLRDVVDNYAALLADARLSIGDVGVLPPGSMPGAAANPGDAAFLEEVFGRRGVASVRLPFYLDYPFADPLGADRAAAVAFLRRSAAWARAQGWGDRMFVFAIDEPGDERAGDVRELYELVHEADPGLRSLITRESSATAFRGIVDIWAPNISPTRFHDEDVRRERAAGRDTWWYPSITTNEPYPTLFVDDRRPSPRALGWLAWEHGVTGLLYWSATHWHEVKDPYKDPATYREPDATGNGDGVLLYPGGPIGLPGTPVPSVRLMQLRDGVEDHDLLVQATCAARPADVRAINSAVRLVAPSMDVIKPTDADVESLRERLFSAIDAALPSGVCRVGEAG